MQPYGAGKLLSLLYPYVRGQRDAHPFTVHSKTGSVYRGSTGDFHAHPFAVNGYSDWRNWAVALAVCRPGDMIVEVGANIGTETVGYSDIVGAAGRVVAFEPLPSNLAVLRSMVSDLRHPNVTLLPYALSDHSGSETFAVPPASMSQGTGHLLGPAEVQTATTTYWGNPVEMDLIEVPTRPLDEFRERLRGVRLLVADAEGSEIPILRGGRTALATERPVLVLEASQPHQQRASHSLQELHSELSSLQYSVYAIMDLGLRELTDAASAPESSNWLCLPPGGVALLPPIRRCLRRCALTPCVLGLNPLMRPSRR
jgi:FkbM family methyltransferase